MAKSTMKKCISFKAKEKQLWDYLELQLDAAYYIKMLIFNDMNNQNIIYEETSIKNEVKIKDKTNYMDIEF